MNDKQSEVFQPGIGATNELSLRVSVAMLVRVLFKNPRDGEWMLALERKHFCELAKTEKTQARIEHMLKTGKPLRN